MYNVAHGIDVALNHNAIEAVEICPLIRLGQLYVDWDFLGYANEKKRHSEGVVERHEKLAVLLNKELHNDVDAKHEGRKF